MFLAPAVVVMDSFVELQFLVYMLGQKLPYKYKLVGNEIHVFSKASDSQLAYEHVTARMPIRPRPIVDDVKDRHVFGRVPIDLACFAKSVTLISSQRPFSEMASLSDVIESGAELQTFKIVPTELFD